MECLTALMTENVRRKAEEAFGERPCLASSFRLQHLQTGQVDRSTRNSTRLSSLNKAPLLLLFIPSDFGDQAYHMAQHKTKCFGLHQTST